MDYKAKHHRFTQCCFIFFCFTPFFVIIFLNFIIQCCVDWNLGLIIYFDSLFICLALSYKKSSHGVSAKFHTKKNIWFYCLQEIKNEGTKIEKNNIRHLKKIYGFNFGHLYFFYAFDHQFFLFNLMLQCCVYWDLRLIICFKFFLLSRF